MQRNAMQRNATQCNAMQCNAMQSVRYRHVCHAGPVPVRDGKCTAGLQEDARFPDEMDTPLEQPARMQ